MPALSKKYKINYKKRYSITKNKKQGGYKSIKVYHNRVKQPTRKRKYYIGGDIEAPVIYNIFPSGQSYQPNTDCLEKECYRKDDAGEKTTTCLNTRIVMNLFSQTLDDSEKESLYRINRNFTDEEKTHLQDLTEKYLTNYVDSLFSRSIFSKNNVDLTPANTQKLKDLLEVIKPEYVVYLTQNSNLSDEIKQTIRATTQEKLNVVVDNDVIDNALAATSAPATAPATAPAPAPATAPATAPVNIPADNINASNTDVVDAAASAEAEAQTQQAAEAQAEKLRLEAEAEAQKQKAEDEAKKAAKKEEQAQFYAAKKAEMDQRFAQRRADSAAKKIEIDKQNAAKKAERAAAEVKRKEDSAEKKAARAAAALIKEENIAAAANEKKKQRDSAKTSKNKPKSKNGGSTRKKH